MVDRDSFDPIWAAMAEIEADIKALRRWMADGDELAADRAVVVETAVPEPESSEEADSDDSVLEGDRIAVEIDDHDNSQPASAAGRWWKLGRVRRSSRKLRARQNEPMSERFSRVLASTNRVESADPDQVEARIRNLTHGTRGE